MTREEIDKWTEAAEVAERVADEHQTGPRPVAARYRGVAVDGWTRSTVVPAAAPRPGGGRGGSPQVKPATAPAT
jgi:hypothetical protein